MSGFKSRLRAGDTVSRATYEAGFGSSSRVYERADAMLGMTPASFRRGGAGVRITYTIADSPIGRVLVATTDRGVCAVELGATDADVERALARRFSERDASSEATTTHARGCVPCSSGFDEPAARRVATSIPLDVDGTAFQWRVWKALQEIPAGERRTYQRGRGGDRPAEGDARRGASVRDESRRGRHSLPSRRARGRRAGGYKWGVERKRKLLDAEESARSSRECSSFGLAGVKRSSFGLAGVKRASRAGNPPKERREQRLAVPGRRSHPLDSRPRAQRALDPASAASA